jgi:hypothetical protein
MSQRGWLTKEDRKKRGKVWVFHWYKARPGDGERVENTAVVGRVANFSKESGAWEEVDRRGLNHNIAGANSLVGRITFGELAHSYEQHALPLLRKPIRKQWGVLTRYHHVDARQLVAQVL